MSSEKIESLNMQSEPREIGWGFLNEKNIPNILVTGGTGYIGSHIIKTLISTFKTNIVSLDKKENPNQKYLNGAIFIKGDIRDRNLTSGLFRKYKIGVVIHLAAYIRIEESMKKPEFYFKNNVVAGLRLLESMRKCNVKNIIYSSSAGIYGIPKVKLISENCEKKPINVYGLTKLLFENILHFYERIYGLNYVIFRIFNVAGADPEGNLKEYHKPETHLIPQALRSIHFNKPVTIYGSNYNTQDGTCIRDYIHVNDVCQAFLKTIPRLFRGKIGETFNLGSSKGYSVLEVINTSGKVLKKQPNINWQEKRAGDPALLVADCKKLKEVLKWKPKYKLKDMIQHAFNSLYGKTYKL